MVRARRAAIILPAGIGVLLFIVQYRTSFFTDILHEVQTKEMVPYTSTYTPSLGSDNDKQHKIKKRFEQRRAKVRDTCKRIKKPRYSLCEYREIKTNLKYVESKDIVYCAIQKSGSTFWKRILHVAGGWGNSSNPQELDAAKADATDGGFITLLEEPLTDVSYIVHSSESILFTRDPFTRLFSAWYDKFYSANPFYWDRMGKAIIQQERTDSTVRSRLCGHDVTFPEFVNYTINQVIHNNCFDGHFAPNFKHCAMCVIDFKYLGKYETFEEDTRFLIKKLNISNQVHIPDFRGDADIGEIESLVKFLFAEKENFGRCVSFRCAIFRVWRRLQGRGLLDKTSDFPFLSEDFENVTIDEVLDTIAEARKKTDALQMKANRMEALVLAFKQLDKNMTDKFVSAFDLDFRLFGYERNPDFLHTEIKEPFGYFDQCPFL